MKNLFLTFIKVFLLISILSLLGCNAQTTAAPTVDPQIYASTVSAAKTEAVQSVYLTLTQAATPTQLPTNTPQSTQTSTMTSVPTLTPSKVFTGTSASTITPTQGAFQCSITKLVPKYGTTLASGTDFDLAVTLENTGTEKWSKGNIDFEYINGAKLQKSVDAIDLPSDVASGDSIDLVIDMKAGSETGSRNTTWGLARSSTSFCLVNVHINVR